MPTRKATGEWKGDLKSGKGTVSLASGAFSGPYSFVSRFEQGSGTNPEELIAAAHAGCYSMALSHGLASAGFTPNSVRTVASVTLDKVEGGFAITQIDLDMEAEVPAIDEKTFLAKAEEAKKGCPISKALAAVPKINLKAKLLQKAAH
jgi:osmotically inducible protein OsmC